MEMTIANPQKIEMYHALSVLDYITDRDAQDWLESEEDRTIVKAITEAYNNREQRILFLSLSQAQLERLQTIINLTT